MKELDILTLLAVFQEMLGWALWGVIGLALLAVLAFLWVLRRDRGLAAGRLLWAEGLGVLGGLLAVAVMFGVTHSHPRDMGGPVDWLLAGGIFAAGLLGTTVAAYAVMGLAARPAARTAAPQGSRARA